jgi:transcriptional regulator with XRE-family HTH domain
VLLMQPIFKCWTGRCQTRQQLIDLAHLPPPHTRQNEQTQQSTIKPAGQHHILQQPHYGAVERGERNVSLTNIVRIAEALDTPLATIFARAEALATST